MVAFVAIAVMLAVAALAGVLWPLWRESRALVAASVLVFGLGAGVLYRVVGTPDAIGASAAAMPATLEAAIAQLQEELERNPEQPEGWRLLGKTLASQDKPSEAAEAYAKAARLQPDDADLLVEAAQASLYAAKDRKLDAQAIAWVRHALTLRPGHQRATWLLGVWHRQEGQPAEAASTWQPLLAEVDPATAASLRQQIDLARAEAGLPPLPATVDAAAARTVRVMVALDPAFASRVRLDANAAVFVIARIPGGPPMPVAVEKHALRDLPLELTLDDGDSPMPTQKLSTLAEVELVARVSASGDPTRKPGDLESRPVRVSLPSTAPVQLVLGESAP